MTALHVTDEDKDLSGCPSVGEMNTVNIGDTERTISVIAGSWLLASAFKSRPFCGRNIRNGIAGAFLLYRGLSGHSLLYTCLGKQGRKPRSVNIRTSLIVNKPVEEVYAFWRELEHLPAFMRHLSSVKETSPGLSHWELELPGNLGRIGWDAEIVKEETNKMLSWKSVRDSVIENAGKVTFSDALGAQGTALDIMITYRAPGGDIGRNISRLLNPVFKKMVQQDLIYFKEFIESR
ncbi:YgaP-like transmembrane domain [Compostibacter hankyongensis]|uniref:Ribosome association toxin RatA n=1 Tax=Compostibacter hankyongensis TaxID=1007089 RepID=A0ABP8FZB8_9BACT